jgi:hypothetical protein
LWLIISWWTYLFTLLFGMLKSDPSLRISFDMLECQAQIKLLFPNKLVHAFSWSAMAGKEVGGGQHAKLAGEKQLEDGDREMVEQEPTCRREEGAWNVAA